MIFGLFSFMLIVLAHFLIFGELLFWLGEILFIPVYVVNLRFALLYHEKHARKCYKL